MSHTVQGLDILLNEITAPRPATPNNISALKSLAKACFEAYIPLMGKMPAPGLETFEEPIRQGHVLVLGDPIFAYLIAFPAAPGFCLDTVAVSPDHQGKGYGKQLISFAEDLARDGGHDLIWLYTNETMTANLELYPKLGYELYDRREQDGYRRVFFQKRLN